MYVSFLQEGKEKSHKSLIGAWANVRYQKVLKQFIDKDYLYFKIKGKSDDIKYFECVKSDFSTKSFYPDSKVYDILKELSLKYVYSRSYLDSAIFQEIIKEYEHEKGFSMCEIKVLYYGNEMNLKILKSDMIKLNIIRGRKLPVKRFTNSNSLRLDYDLLNEELGNNYKNNYFDNTRKTPIK